MEDISQGPQSLGAILGNSVRQISTIWGRVILWTILIFLINSFVAVFIMAITGLPFENGWSASGYLYNWIAITLAYGTIVKFVGYLLAANHLLLGEPGKKPQLVRTAFLEIAIAAAIMAVPQTLVAEDGLTLWDFVVSVPWSFLDGCVIATILVRAIAMNARRQGSEEGVKWREAPGPITVKLMLVYSLMTSAVGLTLEYLRGLRMPVIDGDYSSSDVTTEWIIYLSHIGAFGIATAFAAGVFVAWYKLLPSVQANPGGIRNIFS
ncbi:MULTISPECIES: hypothetical protein [Kordiimonas]|jgi:hypothetical protein|uniref:Uncharacterized protein n=1 Tax=Kordiimonas lacus TaxID=637679 RepID=A0A1G6YDM2_9PROT|nr:MULTISPECIES: hypothetical protein [Kordiimonas]SDD88468.1 hypothetical protein SAMN04488071_1584 [Kordiimonas lacus]